MSLLTWNKTPDKIPTSRFALEVWNGNGLCRREHTFEKSKLLEATLSLIITKGYHGTTVDEICAAAGVTKGSFFHYFKTKEDIGKAAIEQFESMQAYLIAGAELDLVQDPWEKLQAYLDFFVALAKDPSSPSGCLTAVMTQELSDTHSEFRSLCEEKLFNNTKPLKKILDEVMEQYPSHIPTDSQQLSDYFLSLYQGSLILAKARDNRIVLEKNVELFRQYLRSAFNKN
ncbi:TetR/AcrR family transcriptional regulator [Paenibacillus hexagrammi]|uniref:TetR/AcrR family transcriptional regulator n=1 Tax=Paenibacillus hexagrammi TaxID=2908839 RepID=A0ABY3SE45_9BACL|nr:TetR/AcrR family transcriptional regulator [Paenibacillus sp. YPD9-1]UJF31678.1 TetR/AcrR family transcriptional regulator [Paenibacillus sp. YPD9-1]